METSEYYRAMEAFCRQRAQMDGEDDRFWLAEAERFAKLVMNRINMPGIISSDIVQAKASGSLAAH